MELPLSSLSEYMHPMFRRQPTRKKLAAAAPSSGARSGERYSEPTQTPAELELSISEICDIAMAYGPVCPDCNAREVVRNGKRGEIQRYRCKKCRRCFTPLTGTLLEGLHLRDKFLHFCLCMMQGLSVRAAAREVGISKNTSFEWRHRIISTLQHVDSTVTLDGIVEITQRPLRPSGPLSSGPSKRQSKKPRVSLRLLGCSNSGIRQFEMYLIFAVDRKGRVRAQVITAEPGGTFGTAMRTIVSDGATICARRGPWMWHPICDHPGPILWTSSRVGRMRHMDRITTDPLHHADNATSLMIRFGDWLRDFHAVSPHYILRYVSWFWRMVASHDLRLKTAAKALLSEIISATSIA